MLAVAKFLTSSMYITGNTNNVTTAKST